MKPPQIRILRTPKDRKAMSTLVDRLRQIRSCMTAIQGVKDFDYASEAWNRYVLDSKVVRDDMASIRKRATKRVVIRMTKHWVWIGNHKIHVPKGTTAKWSIHLRMALHCLLWALTGAQSHTRTRRDAQRLTDYYLHLRKHQFPH